MLATERQTQSHVPPRRVGIVVRGTVQGVGFRPFVYRLATELGLSGSVRNDSAGVSIEIEGIPPRIDQFLARLVSDAPRHARIAHVGVEELVSDGLAGFVVDGSRTAELATTSVPADIATCDECLHELYEPSNRRFRYPFINCTNCGPRFTITSHVPYDRAATTMAGFSMCEACAREYDDPGDRRFHAQPNACWACGPVVRLLDPHGATVAHAETTDPIIAAANALRAGAVVAVKGLGGYHLACRAGDADAVGRLRARKQRDDKPFAIMVASVEAAATLAELRTAELTLLTSAARPIVLLRPRTGANIAREVAPAARDIGVVLPYTPLHHLLLGEVGAPLVMTSGNRTDEPIAYRDEEALDRLAGIADLFLVHDRPIDARCEDSVVRSVVVSGNEQTLMIRRSRGFVPNPIPLPTPATEGVLGAGGQLKNTVCVARGNEAIVGPHGGDLGDAVAHLGYARGIDHLIQLSGVPLNAVAHDLHPDYHATRYALERHDLTAHGVQHHHAHFAGCLAEHGESGPAIGLIFDGSGLGDDGAIWGGEILAGDVCSSRRVGHLRAVALPGGDAAVREPWRMACSWLADAHGDEPGICTGLDGVIAPERWHAVARLALGRVTASLTTSVGRLLDACAAICGIRATTTYEGQAAIELEALADARRGMDGAYPCTVREDDEIIIDPRPLVLAVERDVHAGRSLTEISAWVHYGLVYAAANAARAAAERSVARTRTVVLSGGVFQNVLLLEGLAQLLGELGFRVLVPQQLPPNDGGLSYGQVVAAICRAKHQCA